MRCNSRHQHLTATQCQASSLIYIMTRFRQWVAKKTRMATIVVLLGLGGGWITTEAFAPQIAQAYTDRVELSVDRQPNETYETLVNRAEAAARAAAQASFDRDIQVTDVSIIIVGQNQGAIAPVLSLKVSRPQWRSRPDAQHWTTYFTNAQFLLRFKDLATTTPAQPETDTPATPEQPTNSNPDQQGTDTPPNKPEKPLNNNPDQPGNYTPPITPAQPTNNNPGQQGTDTPATPSQTPAPSPGLVPQAPFDAPAVAPPGNPQSPTPPNSVSPDVPSTSTPADTPQAPTAAPPNSGTTINNPAPNSSGNIPFGNNE